MKQLGSEGVYLGLMGIASMNIRFIEGFIWWIRAIKELSDYFVLGTDSGHIQNPTHMDGLRWTIRALIAFGVTPEEINKMISINPRGHTGIGTWPHCLARRSLRRQSSSAAMVPLVKRVHTYTLCFAVSH